MLLSMEREKKESRHGKKIYFFFLSLAIIFSVAGFATYAEDKTMIFVSPNGNDNSSGTMFIKLTATKRLCSPPAALT